MPSKKTLIQLLNQNEISNGDIRYLSEEVKQEINNKTKNCTGSIREKLFWLQNQLKNYPICKTCQNSLSSKHFYLDVKGGRYISYCSRKCSANCKELNNQKQQTNLQKYGSEQFLSSKFAREKIEKTNLEKYGSIVAHKWCSPAFYQYIENKYGTKNIHQVEEIRLKLKRKKIETRIISGSTSNSIQNCESRFNVICCNPEIALDKNRDSLEILPLKWKHLKCQTEYFSSIIDGLIKRCPKCFASVSELEISLREMICNEIPKSEQILFNVQNILPNSQELDIYFPNKKVAIEFNGIYWHSEKFKDKFYHVNKTNECLKLGIKLIHIWEHNFVNKKEIIKSIILNTIGYTQNKIAARKCIVREIDKTTYSKFCIKNHLNGTSAAKITLGCFYENELVQVMSFKKPRFDKQYEWEIIRLCTKLNTVVIGGANKCLKYFIQNYKPKSILSYADRSLGEGTVYEKMGFELKDITTPGYFWVNNEQIISRYQTQKLLKLNLTENEKMSQLGFTKIWNCGNNKWAYV